MYLLNACWMIEKSFKEIAPDEGMCFITGGDGLRSVASGWGLKWVVKVLTGCPFGDFVLLFLFVFTVMFRKVSQLFTEGNNYIIVYFADAQLLVAKAKALSQGITG